MVGLPDSDSDSGLLIDSDSGSDSDSDSGPDTKHKINNILIVKGVCRKKRDVIFSIGFGLRSFGRKIFIPVITNA